MKQNLLRIGVLMGGVSAEKDISLHSGRTICDHLDPHIYEIVPLFQAFNKKLYRLPWQFWHRGKIKDFETRLVADYPIIDFEKLPSLIDLLFIAQHGGAGENGGIQGICTLLNIPFIGSGVLASALCMNKKTQKHLLKSAGFLVAPFLEVNPDFNGTIDIIYKEMENKNIPFPCITKPLQEGSSLGVNKVSHPEQLLACLNEAFYIDPLLAQPALIEKYIEGKEFSCLLLEEDNKWTPLPLTYIACQEEIYTYKQKYMPGCGRKITPAPFDQKTTDAIYKTCIKAAQLFDIKGLVRIDGIITGEDSIYLIDLNSNPGSCPSSLLFEQAAHTYLSPSSLMNKIISQACLSYQISPPLQQKTDVLKAPPLKVGVFFGGDSNEQEISYESGRNVIFKLSGEKYEVFPIFVNEKMLLYQVPLPLLVKHSTREVAEGCTSAMQLRWQDLPQKIDFAFLALHGGKGENGCVQAYLEMLEIPYNGSGVKASSLCMNKSKTHLILKSHDLEVPSYYVIPRKDWERNGGKIIEEIKTHLNFPLIIKPNDDGCSVGVCKIKEATELEAALHYFFSTYKKEFALCEEYIEGTELTVGVIGNKQVQVLPPTWTLKDKEILSIEEKFLPGSGQNITPAPLTPHQHDFVSKSIEKAFKAVECSGYARIDCFFQNEQESNTGKERLIILEVNTLPALTPATCLFHQASEIGITPIMLLDKLISLGLEIHRSDNQVKTSKSTCYLEKIEQCAIEDQKASLV